MNQGEKVTISYIKDGRTIALVLDATLRESHDFTNDVTQYPVENAGVAADNALVRPITLSIEGIVTDSPIQVYFEDITEEIKRNSSGKSELSRNGQPTRVETARDILLGIRGTIPQGGTKSAEIVSISTGLLVYPRMAMTSFKPERTSRTGKALQFSASFVEVNIGTLATSPYKPAKADSDKVKAKDSKGKVATKDADKAAKERVSTARKLVDKALTFAGAF